MVIRSIFMFVMTAALAAGAILSGCVFVDRQTSEAILTEETVSGDRTAADGLVVEFRADAGDDLHWFNSFDYASGETESEFKRGELLEADETSIYDDIQRDKTFGKGDLTKIVETSLYDDIRFTGWSAEPFTTKLDYDGLEGLQDQAIHDFYDDIQQRVAESGRPEAGKLRLGDYLDYYPISFRFQLGSNRYDSGDALTGLKIHEAMGTLSEETCSAYDGDVALYTALNKRFRIPVIDSEYQDYKVSKAEDSDPEISLGYVTEVTKPAGAGQDYYEFDPIMVIQEERETGGENRMLFIVNNRTAKGAPVDVSQISGGYGIYELPIKVGTKAEKIGHRVVSVPDLIPLPDQMAMVYPLDETAEYVELSLSEDHRHLAIFAVKEGRYFVELVDADTGASDGPVDLFPESEEMTYAWGEDGSLAATNHQGDIAVLARTESAGSPQAEPLHEMQTEPLHEVYQLIYSGKAPNGLDEAFFGREMVDKKHSYTKYQYGIDEGLAIAAKDGKIALVQNQRANLFDPDIRNASLECAVIDKTGVIYRGRINSNITDLGDDLRAEKSTVFKTDEHMILPVRNENRAQWKTH